MYVKIDLTDYSTIRNLSFAPQTELTCDSVPINEFSVDIITDDAITSGQYAELYDDLDNLWAKYWITYAERESADAVRIRARSTLSMIDGVTIGPTMYSGVDVSTVLDGIIVRQAGGGLEAPLPYTLDSSFSGMTITGFCPEQSARERLQWVCFIIGAYVKTYFNDEIEILPIDSTATLVPLNRTYWKPKINYKDHVTAVKVTAFSFTQGTPGTTDEYVTDGINTWIVTRQDYTLANSAAPSYAADNVVSIDGVYLVNSGNVSAILTYLSELYFKRVEVELSAINNAEYIPGDRLTVYGDADTLLSGYVKSCEFAFGVQARARMMLTAAEAMEGAKLTILCKYGDVNIGRSEYTFPVGYSYTVQNLFIDMQMNGHRYIFRPTTATVTGTMTSAGATATVNYAVALDLELDTGILEIVSVDDLEMADGVVTIA